jgi:hypothetical protein
VQDEDITDGNIFHSPNHRIAIVTHVLIGCFGNQHFKGQLMEWIKVEDWTPIPFKDVLVVAEAYENTTYKPGEKYAAIDHWTIWKDGYEPGFRSHRFGYGKVTHVAEIIMPKDSDEVDKADRLDS